MIADDRNSDRLRLHTALSLQSFCAMERLWACPLVQLNKDCPQCRYCHRSLAEIRGSSNDPDDCLLHRCRAGSSRSILCTTFLNRPPVTAACLTPECWPLPAENCLHCSRCDRPSQLCASHRWACVGTQLCKDCIHEDRPCKVVEVSGCLEASSCGVSLTLKAVNPLYGEVLRRLYSSVSCRN